MPRPWSQLEIALIMADAILHALEVPLAVLLGLAAVVWLGYMGRESGLWGRDIVEGVLYVLCVLGVPVC